MKSPSFGYVGFAAGSPLDVEYEAERPRVDIHCVEIRGGEDPLVDISFEIRREDEVPAELVLALLKQTEQTKPLDPFIAERLRGRYLSYGSSYVATYASDQEKPPVSFPLCYKIAYPKGDEPDPGGNIFFAEEMSWKEVERVLAGGKKDLASGFTATGVLHHWASVKYEESLPSGREIRAAGIILYKRGVFKINNQNWAVQERRDEVVLIDHRVLNRMRYVLFEVPFRTVEAKGLVGFLNAIPLIKNMLFASRKREVVLVDPTGPETKTSGKWRHLSRTPVEVQPATPPPQEPPRTPAYHHAAPLSLGQQLAAVNIDTTAAPPQAPPAAGIAPAAPCTSPAQTDNQQTVVDALLNADLST